MRTILALGALATVLSGCVPAAIGGAVYYGAQRGKSREEMLAEAMLSGDTTNWPSGDMRN